MVSTPEAALRRFDAELFAARIQVSREEATFMLLDHVRLGTVSLWIEARCEECGNLYPERIGVADAGTGMQLECPFCGAALRVDNFGDYHLKFAVDTTIVRGIIERHKAHEAPPVDPPDRMVGAQQDGLSLDEIVKNLEMEFDSARIARNPEGARKALERLRTLPSLPTVTRTIHECRKRWPGLE